MRRIVLSDTHFEHKNIIEYCKRPVDCDTIMANNWAEMAQNDTVSIHLGDVTFGKKEALKTILDRIKGKKYLVRGNHDHFSDSKYIDAGFDGVFNALVLRNVLYTHEPVFIFGGGVVANIHGHLHNLGYEHPASFGGSYRPLNDGKHFLYAPEIFNYKPMDPDGLISYWLKRYQGE